MKINFKFSHPFKAFVKNYGTLMLLSFFWQRGDDYRQDMNVYSACVLILNFELRITIRIGPEPVRYGLDK